MAMAVISTNAQALLLSIGTILTVVYLVRLWQRRPKRVPPGLPTVPLLGSVPFLPKIMDHKAFAWLHRKYGDIYQFYVGSRCVVVLNTRELIHEALVQKGSDFSHRPVTLLMMDPSLNGFSLGSPSDEWKQARNCCVSILRQFSVKRNLELIQTEVKELVDEFEKHAGKTFQPSVAIFTSLSNVIYSMLFSKKFNHTDTRIKKMLADLDKVIVKSSLIDMFPVYRFLPAGRRMLNDKIRALENWTVFLKEEFREHKERTDPEDVDGDFIRAYTHITGEDHSSHMLVHMVSDIFAAATEPTTDSLKWALVRMVNQPEIMRKLQTEIDSVIGFSRLPGLSDRPKMMYTEAFLLELLRHTSVASIGLPHSAARDSELAGYFIPKDATVLTNIREAHFDGSEWPNPEVFDPNRFLDQCGQVFKRDRIIPFNIGMRACVGKTLAEHELFLYLTTILQTFDINPPPGMDKLPEESVFGLTLGPAEFEIVVTPRS